MSERLCDAIVFDGDDPDLTSAEQCAQLGLRSPRDRTPILLRLLHLGELGGGSGISRDEQQWLPCGSRSTYGVGPSRQPPRTPR